MSGQGDKAASGRLRIIPGRLPKHSRLACPITPPGYVYDTESGLYYLQSRYYSPETSRFINADIRVSTGQGPLGNNMFAYCLNDPIMLYDAEGRFGNKFDRQYLYGGSGAAAGIEIVGITLKLAAVGAALVKLLSVVVKKTVNSLTEAAEETRKYREYQYWEAQLVHGTIIKGRGLTYSEATIRVACGFDIMCANKFSARWLLVTNGYWTSVGPEIHGDESDGYHWHYHPNRHSHTHIWFHTP